MMLRYEVWTTDFHGGRRLSRHSTARAALMAARRRAAEGCTCGCTWVYDSAEHGRVTGHPECPEFDQWPRETPRPE